MGFKLNHEINHEFAVRDAVAATRDAAKAVVGASQRLEHAVIAARLAGGVSWTSIAAAAGITRQAALERWERAVSEAEVDHATREAMFKELA